MEPNELENLYELTLIALTMELDEMDRTGPDADRLARAELYLAWLKSESGESFE